MLTDKVQDWHEAISYAQKVYSLEEGGAGHCCHIILDDGNLEAGCVDYCLEYATERDCSTCIDMCLVLQNMTMTQKQQLYKHYREYYNGAPVES